MTQMNLFNRWPDCFDYCRNFHDGVPFPVTNEKRCDTGLMKDGTSGADMELYNVGQTVEMRCKYFEEVDR